ncbi:MAG: hypothetical protein WC812_02545 [Candidatus Pacearchaeota archaeon]|jgi:hypothetical protein
MTKQDFGKERTMSAQDLKKKIKELEEFVEVNAPLFEFRVNSFQIKDAKDYMTNNFGNLYDLAQLCWSYDTGSRIILKDNGEERGYLGYKLSIHTQGEVNHTIIDGLVRILTKN